MKQLFTILLLLSFINLKAQTENASAVDSVFTGKILIDKENRTKIYLTNFQQTLDSTGVYTTTYTFGIKSRRPTFDVNIRMNFDAPLIHDGPVGFQYGPVGIGRYSGSGALRNDSYVFLQGQMTATSHHFFIKIKSKQKVKPVISGLDGQSAF